MEYPNYRSVRDATLADTMAIVQMVKAFYDASPYAGKITWDYNKLKRTVKTLISAEDGVAKIILGLDEDGFPRGMLACIGVEPMFSSDKLATELMWWVDPVYRASRIGLELIGAYESWCRQYKYPVAQMVLLDALNGSTVERLYEKRGYTLVEKAYLKGF